MKIEYIQKCKCGAVTIRFDNSASNSMFWETFEKLIWILVMPHGFTSPTAATTVSTIGE